MDVQFSLFTFEETHPIGKVPISKERIAEAQRVMFLDPKKSVRLLREVRYKLEDFERRIQYKKA